MISENDMSNNLIIKPTTVKDVPLIISFIKELAEYEKLPHEVVATEEVLAETLFGPKPAAEVVIGYYDDQPIGFAIFFYNFSSFLGRSGIYLEDLYVKPEARSKGFGEKLLVYLAKRAKEKKCGRIEWSVLDWNERAIQFYKSIGAKAMDEWTVFRLTGEALDSLAKD